MAEMPAKEIKYIPFMWTANDTDVATGTNLSSFRMQFNGNILQDDSVKEWLFADLETAGTAGTMVVDINKNGTTIMATNKLNIETGEESSVTAATQPDLTVTTFVIGDKFSIDVDAIHNTPGKGGKVQMAVVKTS